VKKNAKMAFLRRQCTNVGCPKKKYTLMEDKIKHINIRRHMFPPADFTTGVLIL